MYEQKQSTLLIVHCVWRAVAAHDDTYQDPANEYWSIGFARHADGTLSVDLFGPTLKPRTLLGHAGEEYWGIEFSAHVFLKDLPKQDVLGTHKALLVRGDMFLLGDTWYQVPEYAGLDKFAERLEQDGVIIAHPQILRALAGDSVGFSERSRQRHVKTVTGLTQKQLSQIKRARHAYYLLQQGKTPVEAAAAAGYADQPHMIRSFKVLRGETPAKIIGGFVQ